MDSNQEDTIITTFFIIMALIIFGFLLFGINKCSENQEEEARIKYYTKIKEIKIEREKIQLERKKITYGESR